MRVLIAVVAIALSIAGINAASAADIPLNHANNARYFAPGQRAALLVSYDYQPGVVVRAYWRAPWRHRHYYPYTGHRPKIGRAENLFAARKRSEPPKTFQRSWSTPWAYLPEPREERSSPPPLRGK